MKLITSAVSLGNLRLDLNQPVALDIETTGLEPRQGARIRLVQLADASGQVVLVDAFKVDPGPLLELLLTTLVIGHHLKFENTFIRHYYGFTYTRIFDTYRASAILQNGTDLKSDLFSVLKRELNVSPWEDMATSDWSTEELSADQLEYAAKDVVHLHRLYDTLRQKVIDNGLVDTLVLEHGAIPAEIAMEQNGIALDTALWRETAAENRQLASRLGAELTAKLPPPEKRQLAMWAEPWNIDSPDQLQKSLAQLGVELESTSKTALSQVEHPIAQELLAYRRAQKRATMYGEDFLQWVQADGRIRTHFFSFLKTGRYSSSNPNLQQCPREASFRRCFVPSPGHVLVLSDYGQIQLRIVAELTGDDNMIRIFREDLDIHTETAKAISKNKNPTKEQRQSGKAINFGLAFGLGADGLVRNARVQYNVRMTRNDAVRFIKAYYKAYPGIKKWHDTAREGTLTRSLGGRLRHMNDDDYNTFLNSPIQSTEADMIKGALGYFQARCGVKAKLLLCVHDEIICECLPEHLEFTKALLGEAMVTSGQRYLKRVPVTADVGYGDSWACK